jgi:hypothetical protein
MPGGNRMIGARRGPAVRVYGTKAAMECGRSSGVERNLAKVEVVSSNLIARSIFSFRSMYVTG